MYLSDGTRPVCPVSRTKVSRRQPLLPFPWTFILSTLEIIPFPAEHRSGPGETCRDPVGSRGRDVHRVLESDMWSFLGRPRIVEGASDEEEDLSVAGGPCSTQGKMYKRGPLVSSDSESLLYTERVPVIRPSSDR